MQDAEVVLEDVGGSLSPSPDDCACYIQEGTWNKVGMVRKILEDTPRERAEWIVYMQPETFFDDTTFSIPFDSYRDKDLVLIGNETALRNGQMRGESRSRTSSAAVKVGMVLICRWCCMTTVGKVAFCILTHILKWLQRLLPEGNQAICAPKPGLSLWVAVKS